MGGAPLNVMILCTHNSARSVLAEAMLKHWAGRLGTDVRAFSADSAPGGRVNPFAIAVVQRAGGDDAKRPAFELTARRLARLKSRLKPLLH